MKNFVFNLGEQLLSSLGWKNLIFAGINGGAVLLGLLGNLFDGFFGFAPTLLIVLGLANFFFRSRVD